MWIIFGWQKERKPLGNVASGYCYDCRRHTNWVVWNESEWVTFSDIRTLRFINRHYLHCENCAFFLELTRAEFGKMNRHMKGHDSIDSTPLHVALTKRIETQQLSSKTALQLKFIQESMAAEQEYQDRLNEQSKREDLR